jgi:hypothetical protein
MSLEDKELGELSQIENNTYCVSSLTRGIKKIPSIEAESRTVVTWGWGWRKWKDLGQRIYTFNYNVSKF